MTARAGPGQRVPPHRRASGPASPGTRRAAQAQARRPGPEPPVLSPERRLGRSPGRRWDARGSTDNRVPVTPERAREPAGGNRPYQSPEGLRAQARSPFTAKMAAATVQTGPLGTPRPEESPPSASMLPVDLRADDARRAPKLSRSIG